MTDSKGKMQTGCYVARILTLAVATIASHNSRIEADDALDNVMPDDYVVFPAARECKGDKGTSVKIPAFTIMLVEEVRKQDLSLKAFDPWMFEIGLEETKPISGKSCTTAREDLLSLDEFIILLSRMRLEKPSDDETVSRLTLAFVAKAFAAGDREQEAKSSDTLELWCYEEALTQLSILIDRKPADFSLMSARSTLRLRMGMDRSSLNQRLSVLDHERAISLANSAIAKSKNGKSQAAISDWIEATKGAYRAFQNLQTDAATESP